VIELLGIGLRGPTPAALYEVCATLEGGQLVVVSAAGAAEREALLDVVTARRMPVEGRLWVDRVPLMAQTVRRIRASVGSVELNATLSPARSLLWNVMSGQTRLDTLGRLLPLPRRRERDAATAALAAVGLAGRAHDRPVPLSGIERVRVLIARALARGPRHLVVRELDRALPPHDAMNILVLLRALTRHDRRVVLVSLAEPTLASALADRLLHLSAGRLAHDGRPGPLDDPGRQLALVRT
jgi:ABC-type phosphate/phosphonate transport system ATPase subunit